VIFVKYIIDMDIGDDIDDALALFFAMKLDIDIVGITTVFGDTEKRARIAKKMLKTYGGRYADVPVFAGCGKDEEAFGKGYMCQYTDDLNDGAYAPDKGNAVDFIIDCCKEYGSDLAVLAIGPFTNIAKVIEKDKDVLNTVGKVVIMGGAYFKQYADWNVMCDVESAAKMYENVSILECLGADVTHTLPIGEENAEILKKLSNGDFEKYLSSLYRLWDARVNIRCAFLHDPLVVYYALHPEVCETEKIAVSVITEGPARGLTLNVTSYGKAWLNDYYKDKTVSKCTTVAKKIDSQKFVDLFMNTIL
ncbi:MAG: nucleoside hydrolase, partial [Clostridia bacterium]|nr:nucleoside hydrolase [Clostridia bacterium]